MSALRLALLLCLVLPLPGLAQDSAPAEGPGPSVTPPPLVPAPPTSEEPSDAPRDELLPREWDDERPSSPTAPRLVLEFFGGSVGGALGIIPGGLLFIAAFSENSESLGILSLAVGFVGVAAGTAGGIVGAASLVDGEGAYWPTLGGVAIGALVGALVSGIVARSAGDAAIIPAATGPILGGMIGYEISHSNAVSRRRPALDSDTHLMPVVSVHPSGGVLAGLVGRF
jgi:hypothetical protein